MFKKIFIFSTILVLVTVFIPQSVLGLGMNVTVTIDRVTSPERGLSIDSSIAIPGTDLEMSLNNQTGGGWTCPPSGYPRIVIIKNALTNNDVPISGNSIDVSGGMDGNNYYRALNIVNGANLAYKSGFSNSTPISSNNLFYLNFTKEGNFSFNYTTTDSPTYKLYLEICGTCTNNASYFCNADCTSVGTPTAGLINCGIEMRTIKNDTPRYWTTADCGAATCTSKNIVFLGASTLHNISGEYNQFYMFLKQLAP